MLEESLIHFRFCTLVWHVPSIPQLGSTISFKQAQRSKLDPCRCYGLAIAWHIKVLRLLLGRDLCVSKENLADVPP